MRICHSPCRRRIGRRSIPRLWRDRGTGVRDSFPSAPRRDYRTADPAAPKTFPARRRIGSHARRTASIDEWRADSRARANAPSPFRSTVGGWSASGLWKTVRRWGIHSRRIRRSRPAHAPRRVCSRGSRRPPRRGAVPRRRRSTHRRCAAARTAWRRAGRPARPIPRKTDSILRIPLPRLLLVTVIESQLIESLLRILDDAATLGHFGRVVSAANFVVEQLAAGVAKEFLQLGGRIEETARSVQLLYSLRQRPKQRNQSLRAFGPVDFLAHRFLPEHGNPRP